VKIIEKPLLEVLFDNHLKQTQFNVIVSSHKEMDRVGFEPTTSAQQFSTMRAAVLSKAAYLIIQEHGRQP
jgi:hypothetical protein